MMIAGWKNFYFLLFPSNCVRRLSALRAVSAIKEDPSFVKDLTIGSRLRSPLLPIAISMLRRNRLCPVRLIGDLEKNFRKAVSFISDS